jgi:hypothetical protein
LVYPLHYKLAMQILGPKDCEAFIQNNLSPEPSQIYGLAINDNDLVATYKVDFKLGGLKKVARMLSKHKANRTVLIYYSNEEAIQHIDCEDFITKTVSFLHHFELELLDFIIISKSKKLSYFEHKPELFDRS